jgi:hypothetical protein
MLIFIFLGERIGSEKRLAKSQIGIVEVGVQQVFVDGASDRIGCHDASFQDLTSSNFSFRNGTFRREYELLNTPSIGRFDQNKIARLSGSSHLFRNPNGLFQIIRSTEGVFRAFVRHIEF